MKKLFYLPIAAIAFLFTGCLNDDIPPPPPPGAASFESITATAISINANNDALANAGENVVVTAIVVDDSRLVTAAHIQWSVGATAEEAILMTAENNTFTATIPGRAAGVSATWNIVLTLTGDDPITSANRTLTWDNLVQVGDADPLAGQLLIFQGFGCGNASPAGANRSFIEIYNTTDAAINLEGITLHWANGIRGHVGRAAGFDQPWQMITFTNEHIIPAGGSFLIAGPERPSGRLVIPAGFGDINYENFILGNRSFKVALIRNTGRLAHQNPFNMDGNGGKAAGYIDLLGSVNNLTATDPDNIFGWEGTGTLPAITTARNSGSEAVRRGSLTDTDNNAADFVSVRYAGDAEGVSDAEVVILRPRNSAAGSWTPEFPDLD